MKQYTNRLLSPCVEMYVYAGDRRWAFLYPIQLSERIDHWFNSGATAIVLRFADPKTGKVQAPKETDLLSNWKFGDPAMLSLRK